MQELEILPNYDQITNALSKIHAMTDAAETHGMLCGFICMGNKMNGTLWLDSLLNAIDANNDNKKNRQLFIDLYDITSKQLKDPEFGFQLLLPDQTANLGLRVGALSDWCHGFITGLGLAGFEEVELEDEAIDDVIKDIIEISKVDFEFVSDDDKDEAAFEEVMEYVRMAVLMIHTELEVQQAESSAQAQQHLH